MLRAFHFSFSLNLAHYVCMEYWLLKQAKNMKFVIFGQFIDVQFTNKNEAQTSTKKNSL